MRRVDKNDYVQAAALLWSDIYTASSHNGSKAMIDIGLKWDVSEYENEMAIYTTD